MPKIKLCKQAENLYIEEGLSVDDICQNLDVARRIFLMERKNMRGIKFGIKHINLKQNSAQN